MPQDTERLVTRAVAEALPVSRNGHVLKAASHGGVLRGAPPFPGLLGKRRTLEILPVLTQAHAAYMGLKRSAKAIKGRGANVFTQWVGDPDALGSAVLLTAILRELGAEEVRILTGSLGHPQNRNLVERCGLKLLDPNKDRLRRGLHCMVDTSPPLGMLSTPASSPSPTTSSWPTTTRTPPRWRRTAAPRVSGACGCRSSVSPWAPPPRSWPCSRRCSTRSTG